MKIMNWKEFCDSLIYKRESIYIPILSLSVDKVKFVTPKGYDTKAETEFLKEIYNSRLLLKK